jgi:hypothetical protein
MPNPPGLLSDAPYGVIINGDRIVIGSPHGKPVELSDDLKNKIQSAASKYGAYYEGDGKDVAPLTGLLGKNDYKGSWDDLVAKNVNGYPEEFLSGIFSNVDANGYSKLFANPNDTIFNSILNNQDKASYFKDRKFGADDLKRFLIGGSEKNADFLSMSNQPATPENLQKFLTTGEQLMWPDNWQEYPNKLGKYAQKFNQARDGALINGPPGVYVAGSGHLAEIAKANKNLQMIGGELASE